MTQTEKRKIRNTNRGLIRKESRQSADLGRLKDNEYDSMTPGIRAKAQQTSRNRNKRLHEGEVL